MRILEAYVGGFGRLVERTFRFSRGVHIVHGANEAGKSTLQQFMLAMLFGLKREDRRRREYLPIYERYRPWGKASYDGRLVYELADGRRFEIQRIFDRQNEALRIVDAITGQDLSKDFPMDSRKERNFLQAQLGLTRQLFEATTSLGQLAGAPEKRGVGELKERIQGLLASGDEAVSARKALDSLRRLRDSLGTERTPTRGIGLLRQQKSELENEYAKSLENHRQVLDIHKKRQDVLARQQRTEKAWHQKQAMDAEHERRGIEARIRQVEDLQSKLHDLQQKLDTFEDVARLRIQDHAPARELAAKLGAWLRDKEERETLMSRLTQRDRELQMTQSRLDELLGGLQREQLGSLQSAAEALREDIGRVREARRRHAIEAEENRHVVTELGKHRGRDWTKDDFMAELRRQQDLSQQPGLEALEQDSSRQVRLYRRQRRAFLWSLALAAGSWTALFSLMWLNPWGLPLWLQWLLPLLGLALLTLALPGSVQRLLLARDRVKSTGATLEQAREVRRAALNWLEAALERNEFSSVESFYRARSDFELLRAKSKRSLRDSPSQEVKSREEALAQTAFELHTVVENCDLGGLQKFMDQPPAEARTQLPFAEESRPEQPLSEDPPEIEKLLLDLASLPQIRRGFEWLTRVSEERTRIEEKRRELDAHLSNTREDIRDGQSRLQRLLQDNEAESVEEFSQKIERFRARERLLMQKMQIEREMAGVLGEHDLETLRARALEGQRASRSQRRGSAQQPQLRFQPGVAPVHEPEATDASADSLAREMETLALERAQLEERLTLSERQERMPSEVDLLIQEIEAKLAQAREQDEALILATQTLESVSTQLHREVAPAMNQRVADIFSRLSTGQLRDVKLDEDLKPRIRSKKSPVHGADHLSGGAADQLYFALRITAGEQLSRAGEHLPLLLDDPFVQYDPERLDAALDLVAEIAQDHQVFFFTCEEAQAEALSEKVESQTLPKETIFIGS